MGPNRPAPARLSPKRAPEGVAMVANRSVGGTETVGIHARFGGNAAECDFEIGSSVLSH